MNNRNRQDDVFSELETIVSKEIEKFYNGLEGFLEAVAEEVEEGIDFVHEQLNTYITPEIEDFLGDVFAPVELFYEELENTYRDNFRDFEVDWSDSVDFDLNPKVTPNNQLHPACVGCKNYHGRVYQGNLLVCAMHPYGWDDTQCPDWEAQE